MVKKLIISFVLICMAPAAFAIAVAGPYVGIVLGTSDMDYTSGNQELGGASKDEENRAWYAFAGYQFNNNFAIQTGYLQFGDLEFDDIGGIANAKSDYTQKALEISGKLIFPLSSVATVYAKGGAVFVNLDRSPNSTASVLDIPNNDKTKIAPIYGLGFTYEFYPNLSGEAVWMQISGNDSIETSTFVGLGVQFAVG